MSNETNETIADIVSEVRRVAYNVAVADANTLNGWRPAAFLSMLADRIEAVHERELADEKRISDAVVQSLRDKKLEMAGEIAEKEAEVKNLRSALKPVLELEDIYDGHWPFASLAADAVKESQRIYKEVSKPRSGVRLAKK